jgi:hypothetical protein
VEVEAIAIPKGDHIVVDYFCPNLLEFPLQTFLPKGCTAGQYSRAI